MGTSASFTPASVPECPYAPRMTRAQALALRAANGLLENCVVVITDGPTIGTAGNTSPTEIELNPTGPSELGLTARVHTTFDNSAWPGVYDIDVGAGAIKELTDSSGNHVVDYDVAFDTIRTQFPWHLGTVVGGTYRDNYIEDSTLTGWATQVGAITNSRIYESTIDLTNKTAGAWTQAEFQGSTVTVSGSMAITRAEFNGGTITKAGTGAFTFTDAQINTFNINQDATSSSPLTIQEANYSAANEPNNVSLLAGSAGLVNLSFGNTGSISLFHNGTGTVDVFGSVGRPVITTAVGSTRGTQINSCNITRSTFNQNGTGGTGIDNFNGCILEDLTANLNNNVPAHGPRNFNLVGSNSTLNVADGPLGAVSGGCVIQSSSTVTLSSGGSIDRCRFAGDIRFVSGAFAHLNSIAEGNYLLTATAANENSLLNAGFNNWFGTAVYNG